MDLQEARRLATALMAQHGLSSWRLVFDSAKTRAGVCRAQRKEIGLSRHLTALHAESEVKDTVLHEIAHALVGPAHGHDEVWRATALRIGCSGSRCVSQDAPRVEGDWVGVCPAGHRRTAHRRPQRVKSCPECAPRFDPGAVFVWTYRGRPAPMHPNYDAELSRLRNRSASGAGGSPSGSGDIGAGPVLPAPRVGDRVRLRGSGKYRDLVGRIESRGRTRYTVRTELGLVTAPFALVERVAERVHS
jgi:predicted SprT family Zn-dependent metalloprotease